MKARKKRTPAGRIGRPPKGGRLYSVKLTDDVAAYYRKMGEGNLTLGIERGALSAAEGMT